MTACVIGLLLSRIPTEYYIFYLLGNYHLGLYYIQHLTYRRQEQLSVIQRVEWHNKGRPLQKPHVPNVRGEEGEKAVVEFVAEITSSYHIIATRQIATPYAVFIPFREEGEIAPVFKLFIQSPGSNLIPFFKNTIEGKTVEIALLFLFMLIHIVSRFAE